MNCECISVKNTVKSHHVKRRDCVVGEYNLCSNCGTIEWLWMTDELEEEISESPGFFENFFKKGIKVNRAR